jgi:Tfp pilus assembly pilus retraction ATPase PilT
MPIHFVSEASSTISAGISLPPTKVLIETLLKMADKVSDILLSPMRPPEVRINGRIASAESPELPVRLARILRGIVSQRLLPLRRDTGQVAAFEILFSTPRVSDFIAKGENASMSLAEVIRQGARDGMQTFDNDLKRLEQAGVIAEDGEPDESGDSNHPTSSFTAKNQVREKGSKM